MEVKPGHKKTEVGVIPEEWRVSRFGDLCAVYRGGSPRPIQNYITDSPDGVNWIKIGDIGVGAKYIDSTAEKIIAAGVSRSRQVKVGDFLLSNSMSFGRPYILRTEGCIHDGWLVIQAYQRAFDTEFLYYYLSSESVVAQYTRYAAGSSVLNLNKQLVSNICVAAPPTAEQRAIAAALSDVDALLTKLDQLIAKKRDLKHAAMQQLLTGHRRLSGFREPWDERALQSVVTRLEAGVSVRSVEGDGGGADCFVLKTSAVADGNFDASERKPVIPGDRGRVRCPVRAGTVLVSRMNTPDLVGEVGFVDRDHPNSFLPDRLWAASVPKGAVSARWLSYVLSSSEYKQRLRDVATGTSGSMKNISKGAFLGISVKVPTLDEQSAIAQVLSDMDAELVALEARSDKTRQLKQGMMQALLTGQIRLV